MNDAANDSTGRTTTWSLTAALGAAVAASACCTIPLLIVSLGVGGAWVGTLTALEPYRPVFVGLALAALAYAGYHEWRASRRAARSIDCGCEEEAVSPWTRRALLGAGAVVVVTLVASPWLIQASSSPVSSAVVAATGPTSTAQVVLDVEGMTCASCNVTVRKALVNVDGVEAAEVSFEPPRAVVTYDPTRATVDQLVEATTNAGYPSRPTANGAGI